MQGGSLQQICLWGEYGARRWSEGRGRVKAISKAVQGSNVDVVRGKNKHIQPLLCLPPVLTYITASSNSEAMAVTGELPVPEPCFFPTWPGPNDPPPHLSWSALSLDSAPKWRLRAGPDLAMCCAMCCGMVLCCGRDWPLRTCGWKWFLQWTTTLNLPYWLLLKETFVPKQIRVQVAWGTAFLHPSPPPLGKMCERTFLQGTCNQSQWAEPEQWL